MYAILHRRIIPEAQCIAKIFVYKHCFCYLSVENVKQEDSLFH